MNTILRQRGAQVKQQLQSMEPGENNKLSTAQLSLLCMFCLECGVIDKFIENLACLEREKGITRLEAFDIISFWLVNGSEKSAISPILNPHSFF